MLSDAWRQRLAGARRAFGLCGTLLLGGALCVAPIQAFSGDMRAVSAAGIAGIACLIVMRLLPRDVPSDDGVPPPDDAKAREP